jgi:hypothetical protein
MIRYFQLTPDILLEYIYEGDPKLNEDGIPGNVKDICNYDQTPTLLLKSNVFNTKYMCFKNESEGLDSISNLVLPLNNTETQFVVAMKYVSKNRYAFYNKTNTANVFFSQNGKEYLYEDTNYDKDIIEKINSNSDSDSDSDSCDVKYDRCVVHFTSRNYFGSYDGLIFQVYAYMKNHAKFHFASFLLKKTSDLEFKAEHMLYNEKLYTTQIEFDIPSVFAIFTEYNKEFNDALKSQDIDLLENTPIGINIYGVSGSTKGTDDYVRLKTHKLNSIFVPYIYNRLDEISIKIEEDTEGDFYYIDPEMSKSYPSFADYIKHMGENVRSYMIMHELYLKETWVDNNGKSHSEITHKEYHIIDINEDDEDDTISEKFDAKIKYRPICMYGGLNYRATIIDTIKIINTVDNTSYEVTGSIEIVNPYKYGKKLKTLGIKKDSRPIVNVYNKKVDETDNRNILESNRNRSGGFVVENFTQNISSFIESTNIGVSIVELSPEDIN